MSRVPFAQRRICAVSLVAVWIASMAWLLVGCGPPSVEETHGMPVRLFLLQDCTDSADTNGIERLDLEVVAPVFDDLLWRGGEVAVQTVEPVPPVCRTWSFRPASPGMRLREEAGLVARNRKEAEKLEAFLKEVVSKGRPKTRASDVHGAFACLEHFGAVDPVEVLGITDWEHIVEKGRSSSPGPRMIHPETHIHALQGRDVTEEKIRRVVGLGGSVFLHANLGEAISVILEEGRDHDGGVRRADEEGVRDASS